VLLDCVAVEAAAVLARRWRERKGRKRPLPRFGELFSEERVSRAYPLLAEQWAAVLAEVDASNGALNPHDALLLAWARRTGAAALATLDVALHDRGVEVLSTAEQVRALPAAGAERC
jgi:predicted nucleic acid-binding protein